MKKLLLLIIIVFGVWLLWSNITAKEENGHFNISVDKAGVKEKLQNAGDKISSETKVVEEKFNK